MIIRLTHAVVVALVYRECKSSCEHNMSEHKFFMTCKSAYNLDHMETENKSEITPGRGTVNLGLNLSWR